MELSIVIPAYNEAARIGQTLTAIKQYLQYSQWQHYEVIVVSDGSTDNTAAVVTAAAADFPAIRLISYRHNRGKGFAVKTGMQHSRGKILLFSDADGATPITELDRLILPIINNQADIVVASRRTADSVIAKAQPLLRIIAGRIFSWLNLFLLNIHCLDTQCGFKLFRGSVAHHLFDDKISDGFAFDVDILFYAEQQHYRVLERGVTWIDGENSKVSTFKDGFRMLKQVLQLMWKERLVGNLKKLSQRGKLYHKHV